MEFLLDTNVLIWFLENNPKLNRNVADLIEDEQNTIYVSIASFWEIAIKIKLGKLRLSNQLKSIFEITESNGIEILNIEKKHILQYEKILFFNNHNDPFDRIIISTGIEEDFTIISSDLKFKEYQSFLKLIEA